MAKPAKYPKKLRQKLEKVAEAANERRVNPKPTKDELLSLHQHFLPDASVHLMHTRMDEAAGKMEITYFLRPRPKLDVVTTWAPWITDPEEIDLNMVETETLF